MFNQTFFVFAFHVKIINKNIKKDKNKKGNILSGSVIELLLTFLGTSGSLSRQSSGMKDILEKRPFTKKFLFTKVSAFKKSSLHQSDPCITISAYSMKLSCGGECSK